MKKLTFALFVAFGATLFVSCGPKIDTPENLGKSLLEAFCAQDKEAVAELFMTKEEMVALIEEESKTEMDEARRSGVERVKTDFIARGDEKISKEINESFEDINEKAKRESINWDEVEFVRLESKQDNWIFKSVKCKVFFKTESLTDLFLVFNASQIFGEWKIIGMEGGIGGFK